MDKKDILTQLRNARTSHIQWRAYAQALVSGIPVAEEHVPVIHTNCKFGQWYYGQGQALSSLDSYEAIATPHESLHQIYINIFKLLFGEDDRSAMQKLFGSSSRLKKNNQQQAQELMQNLLDISETLLLAIRQLEDDIKNMSDAELAELY
mgnify:CR=1 FL=1